MNKSNDSQFQAAVTWWLRIATGVFLLAPLAAPTVDPDRAPWLLYLPMVNCFAVWAVIFVYYLPWQTGGGLQESDVYIKERYPHIWKKLHPWGDFSFNQFTGMAFLFGKYDDGSDPRLAAIKARAKRRNMLIIWPFVLIPLSWAVTFTRVFISIPFHQ